MNMWWKPWGGLNGRKSTSRKHTLESTWSRNKRLYLPTVDKNDPILFAPCVFFKAKAKCSGAASHGMQCGTCELWGCLWGDVFFATGRWLSQNTSNPNGAKKILEEIPEQVMIMIWFGNFSWRRLLVFLFVDLSDWTAFGRWFLWLRLWSDTKRQAWKGLRVSGEVGGNLLSIPNLMIYKYHQISKVWWRGVVKRLIVIQSLSSSSSWSSASSSSS